MKQAIFVGNYSEDGINQIEFDNGKIIYETLKIGNTKNNSYVCKYKNYLYTVIEVDGDEKEKSGYVSAYELKGNEVKLINSVISYGASPCFLVVDESRDILYVANYSGGSFVAFKIEEDGKIGQRLYYQKYEDNSRVHHIQFSKDYKRVYIIDLGTDCIIEYEIIYNNENLNLKEVNKFYFKEKTGPRHMVIDEKENIYVVTEKSCELYKLGHDSQGKLIVIENKSILPDGTKKEENFTGCAIKIDSKMKNIYVSVREHDSISVFDIKEKNMELVQNVKCEGKIPRDISLDKEEKYLICANQGSDNISIFCIENGKLSYKSKYDIKCPTCILVN